MKKFKHIQSSNINESLAYTNFFGKKVSHEDALKKELKDTIIRIVMEDNNISEKDFSRIDDVMEKVASYCDSNLDVYVKANEYYENNRRLELLAEKLYDKSIRSLFKKDENN